MAKPPRLPVPSAAAKLLRVKPIKLDNMPPKKGAMLPKKLKLGGPFGNAKKAKQ